MSETTRVGLPAGPRTTLFDHALALHRQAPDRPLPRDGEPFPDDGLHRHRPGPLADLDADDEMVDHVGRLLLLMSDCGVMGLTLARYPHAATVLAAHARHAGSLSPTVERFFTIALLARHLTTASPEAAGCTAEQQEALRTAYVCLLDRDEWAETARAALAEEHEAMRWLVDARRPQVKLRAFAE